MKPDGLDLPIGSKNTFYSAQQDNKPMTRSALIAKLMKRNTTPTETMAAAYFRAGLRKGWIKKAGPELYLEETIAGEERIKREIDGSEMEIYEY
jgi:hypothetical protein